MLRVKTSVLLDVQGKQKETHSYFNVFDVNILFFLTFCTALSCIKF